jgi:3-isopropylmalate dehydrogenase
MNRVVAVIPGEDAAPEAVEPTVALLSVMGLPIDWIYPEVGAEAVRRHGNSFPESARTDIDRADATLFGATSGASALALFYLRWGKRTFANVRPTRWFPGLRTPLADPRGIDLVVVRENLEDLYVFAEGRLADLAPLQLDSITSGSKVHEIGGEGGGAFAIKAITHAGAQRVIRFAFELARRRKGKGLPGRVTLGAKWNMLPQTDGLFRKTGEAVAGEYADVAYDAFLIDDLAHRLVVRPQALDVVVMPNSYGDILSDAAAGLAGGLGVAASGCYGEDYAYFESAHGTAPDLAGRHIINPTATLLSAAMMLDYLGMEAAATRLRAGVECVYAAGVTLTPDHGGTASTDDFCRAVGEAMP